MAKEEMDAGHLARVLARQGDESLNQRLSRAPGAFRGSPADELTSAEGGVLAESYAAPFELAAEVARNARDAGAYPGDPELVRTALEAFGERHVDDTDSGVVQGNRYIVAPSAAKRSGQYVIDGRTADGQHDRAVPRPALAQPAAAVNLAQDARSLTDAQFADWLFRQDRADLLHLSEDERGRLNDGRGDPAKEMQAGW